MSFLVRQMLPIDYKAAIESSATLEATVSPVKPNAIYTCDTKVDFRKKRIEENWIYELQNSRED